MSSAVSSRSPIAIVGIGAIFPQSIGVGAFWNNILRGKDLITEVPASHWLLEDYYDSDLSAPDMTYAQKGGFIPDVDFDPIEWGVTPSIIPATDTTQLLALIIAKKCMEEAHNGDFQETDLNRISYTRRHLCTRGFSQYGSRLQHPIWRKVLPSMVFLRARYKRFVRTSQATTHHG